MTLQTSTPAAQALEALKSGADVGAAVYGEPLKTETPHVYESDESEEPETESSDELPLNTSNIEEIVSGGRKMKIDWNDKESIKRQIQMAGGVSKLKSQHDAMLGQKKELEAKHSELSEIMNVLESTFQKQGAKGVINLLAGKDDAWDNQLKQEMARAKAYENATPDQRNYLELQEALEAERKEKASILADVKSQTERAKLDREAADRSSAEAAVHPVFEKYRFAGKLGDTAVEQQLDDAIWSKAVRNIQEVPEHELTQARIDKEFRSVAATFQKMFKDQGSKNAEKVLAKKKENATAAVGAAAVKGMAGVTGKGTVRERIASGDLKSALADVLMGRVKL